MVKVEKVLIISNVEDQQVEKDKSGHFLLYCSEQQHEANTQIGWDCYRLLTDQQQQYHSVFPL